MKNILGQLTFDTDLMQLIRRGNQTVDIFDDPLSQAENLKIQLQRWLRQHCGLIQIPILDRVVITSSAELNVTDRNSSQIKKIIRRSNLRNELYKLNQQYPERCITSARMKKIETALLSGHKDRIVDPFSSFRIDPNQIHKGVCLSKLRQQTDDQT
ncbi:MAG: hypothetical protein ACE3JK_02155 [Sporolactobacillus sp.]